jgi:hypothetical protein
VAVGGASVVGAPVVGAPVVGAPVKEEQDKIMSKSKIGIGSVGGGDPPSSEHFGGRGEALPGGENPESEKKPWRYDPWEVSRKIREAEKARRMRRRQIEM